MLCSQNWKHVRSKVYEKLFCMNPPFRDRNSNAEVCRRTREACESRSNPTQSCVEHLTMYYRRMHETDSSHSPHWSYWDKSALKENRQHHIPQHADDPVDLEKIGHIHLWYQWCRSETKHLNAALHSLHQFCCLGRPSLIAVNRVPILD